MTPNVAPQGLRAERDHPPPDSGCCMLPQPLASSSLPSLLAAVAAVAATTAVTPSLPHSIAVDSAAATAIPSLSTTGGAAYAVVAFAVSLRRASTQPMRSLQTCDAATPDWKEHGQREGVAPERLRSAVRACNYPPPELPLLIVRFVST